MIESGQSGVYKSLRISILSLAIALLSTVSFAEDHSNELESGGEEKKEEKLDPIAHIQDAHNWHFWTSKDEHGHEHHVSAPLPVILYSSDRGLEIFSSSHFHGDHATLMIDGKAKEGFVYNGYFIDHHMIKIYAVKPFEATAEEHTHGDEAGHGEAHEAHGDAHGVHHVYMIDESRSFYDFSLTKNVVSMLISVLILFLVFFSVKRGYKKNNGKAPKGIQSFFEPIIIFVRDDIAKANIGEKKYMKYTPYLLCIFFFIWFNNVLGLLPAAANVTGNIAVTMVLALFTLVVTLISSGKAYWSHILDPLGNSLPWGGKILLYLILWPIEIIGIFTKPFSLMVRLFANISAGHILILSIIGLTFMSGSYVIGGVSALFATVMNMLELFVAILQAYVFTMLTAMYFGSAVEEGHH